AEEVNVKEVHLETDIAPHATLVLQVEPRLVGPRLGRATQGVMQAARDGNWRRDGDGRVELAGQVLQPEEFTLLLQAVDEGASATLPGETGLVVLNLEVTPELQEEGLARDVVRLVQTARKEADLHISNRIHLVLGLPLD